MTRRHQEYLVVRLADAWESTASAPRCPPPDPTALASAVACDQALRFPAATAPVAHEGAPKDPDSYFSPRGGGWLGAEAHPRRLHGDGRSRWGAAAAAHIGGYGRGGSRARG